jgi:hypothetical protein
VSAFYCSNLDYSQGAAQKLQHSESSRPGLDKLRGLGFWEQVKFM